SPPTETGDPIAGAKLGVAQPVSNTLAAGGDASGVLALTENGLRETRNSRIWQKTSNPSAARMCVSTGSFIVVILEAQNSGFLSWELVIQAVLNGQRTT
ncbi:MAG: hypothetical protein U0X75_30575, partial [Acidobacteriota bacterium]